MVLALPLIQPPDKVCEGCLVSKQPRSTFKSYAPTRAAEPLVVIHSDVCGLTETLSLGGNKYFVIFVDEFTRKMWLYLIKLKSEVFSVFQRFYAIVEAKWERNQDLKN